MLRQDLLKKKSLEEAKKKAEAYRQQIQDIANTLLADRNALEDVLKIVGTELSKFIYFHQIFFFFNKKTYGLNLYSIYFQIIS